jgi:hypothetical protein
MNQNGATEPEPAHPAECMTCLGKHEEDIHAATVNVHAWFHHQVVKNLEDEAQDECDIYYLAEAAYPRPIPTPALPVARIA